MRTEEPDCWLCGKPIDYNLPNTHPMAYELDHIVPVADGGLDVRSNVHASHGACNRERGAGSPPTRLPASRDW